MVDSSRGKANPYPSFRRDGTGCATGEGEEAEDDDRPGRRAEGALRPAAARETRGDRRALLADIPEPGDELVLKWGRMLPLLNIKWRPGGLNGEADASIINPVKIVIIQGDKGPVDKTLRFYLIAWAAILTFLSVAPALAAQGSSAAPPELASLREFLALPDEEIDLGKAKLLVDRVIDPAVDVAATLAQLDAMAAEIRAALPPGASSFDTAQFLRAYLYALGPWSGQAPFRYDLDDPYGKVFEHRLLHNYMHRRRATASPCRCSFSSWGNASVLM